jgi:hypothetical protein
VEVPNFLRGSIMTVLTCNVIHSLTATVTLSNHGYVLSTTWSQLLEFCIAKAPSWIGDIYFIYHHRMISSMTISASVVLSMPTPASLSLIVLDTSTTALHIIKLFTHPRSLPRSSAPSSSFGLHFRHILLSSSIATNIQVKSLRKDFRDLSCHICHCIRKVGCMCVHCL